MSCLEVTHRGALRYRDHVSSTSSTLPPARLQLREAGPCALVLRPELVRIAFSARVDEADGTRAVAVLEAALTAFTRELTAALPGSLVVMRNLEWRSDGKLKSRGSGDGALPVVSGHLEVPLTAAQDYWQRARVLAALDALTSAAYAHGRARKPPLDVQFSAPLPLLRDPEAHRGALIQRWLDRLRQLSELAEASRVSGPLQLRECAAPGPVTQHPISLEEVELRLALGGPLIGDTSP